MHLSDERSVRTSAAGEACRRLRPSDWLYNNDLEGYRSRVFLVSRHSKNLAHALRSISLMPLFSTFNCSLPDFGKCGPAINDLIPAAQEAINYFISTEWLNMDQTGTKDWNQQPVYACWYNIPLCLGMCCLPCCPCAVVPRNLSAMTGNSCESEALKCCLLSICCCE